ncbi:MAG: serine/threonine protein kinase [Chloroflexi bacterium]|nr:serine/threonine protein kinase [Chloroflexota bacterium]
MSEPGGRTFASGRYIVRRLLGQGAQKSVYLVDDTVLGRQCALSVLNAALLDPSDVDRIKREAQTMAQLGTQPNIVTVYDYGEEDGAPFIVCEYVPGGELRDELAAAAGPLALERALAVAIDICRALSFAHGRDIVHRDLKPENVWLTEERSAKLGDFGIALSLGRTRLTMAGGITGTATYMAPEQVSGGDVDARSDLYALGVLLYEMVTGRPPFVGDDPNTIMYQHVNAEPESPVKHSASVPPNLERLIMTLLAKTKAERPASAEEVLAELERVALAEGWQD